MSSSKQLQVGEQELIDTIGTGAYKHLVKDGYFVFIHSTNGMKMSIGVDLYEEPVMMYWDKQLEFWSWYSYCALIKDEVFLEELPLADRIIILYRWMTMQWDAFIMKANRAECYDSLFDFRDENGIEGLQERGLLGV